MLKKQLILLTTLLLLLIHGTAAAANWQWVYSDEDVGLFFDTNSIKFQRIAKGGVDKNIIYVWARYVYGYTYAQKHPHNGQIVKMVVLYEKMDIGTDTVTDLERVFYNNNGDFIDALKKGTVYHVVPGSYGDMLYSAIKEYARIHSEEITDRSLR